MRRIHQEGKALERRIKNVRSEGRRKGRKEERMDEGMGRNEGRSEGKGRKEGSVVRELNED